jgi:tRNA(Met) C34 N-acetyltransferase TmcA
MRRVGHACAYLVSSFGVTEELAAFETHWMFVVIMIAESLRVNEVEVAHIAPMVFVKPMAFQ